MLVLAMNAASCHRGLDPPDDPPRLSAEAWAEAWRRSADRAVERAFEVRRRYQDASPHEMLAGSAALGSEQVLRLDDALADARVTTPGGDPPTSEDVVVARFEFDGADLTSFAHEVHVASREGLVAVKDGRLVVDRVDRRQLVADLPQPFPAASAAEIHLRARLSAGWEVRLGWRGADGESSYVSLLGSPGEQFRLFRIDARTLVGHTPDATIRQLTLQCPGPPVLEARLEVDFIRVFNRSPSFLESFFGRGRITVGGENRPVLWARPGTEIDIRSGLPDEGPLVLAAGAAALDSTKPLTVTVAIEPADGAASTATIVIEPREGFTEHRIALDVRPPLRSVRLRVEGADGIAALSSPLLYRPRAAPRRVMLLVQDALRADHLSAYGSARPTSTFTDRMAGRGALFRRAVAQAPATRMSVASYFTSLHPTAAGVWTFNEVIHAEYVTLAEVLRHAGWATVSVTENLNAGLFGGAHQGFDRLLEIGADRGALALHGLVASLMDTVARDRPLFLYVHILDPHGPYAPTSGFRGWFDELLDGGTPVDGSKAFDPPWVAEATAEGRVALYDGEIAANDRALGALLDQLESAGWLENTLLILASDHGEFLGEHGHWGHHAPGYPEVLHTPLLMIDPGRIPTGLEVDAPVQNLDLMPTILDLVGIGADVLPFEGESLTPLLAAGAAADPWSRAAFSEQTHDALVLEHAPGYGSLVVGPEFIVHTSFGPVSSMPWRGGGPDPPRPVSPELAREIAELFRRLHREHTEISKLVVGDDDGSQQVSAAAQEQLRELGYLQ